MVTMCTSFLNKKRHFILGAGVAQSYSVWLRTGRPGDRGSIPGRSKRIFPLTSVSRPALWPTQLPVQWVLEVLSPGVKRGRGVTLTTHPYLGPRSWMSRTYTLHHLYPWTSRVVLWGSFTFSIAFCIYRFRMIFSVDSYYFLKQR
jgi:hypothetical protein